MRSAKAKSGSSNAASVWITFYVSVYSELLLSDVRIGYLQKCYVLAQCRTYCSLIGSVYLIYFTVKYKYLSFIILSSSVFSSEVATCNDFCHRNDRAHKRYFYFNSCINKTIAMRDCLFIIGVGRIALKQ